MKINDESTPKRNTREFVDAVTGNDRESKQILNVLKGMDKDADGKYDLHDVVAAAKQVVNSQNSVKRMRCLVVAIIILWVATVLVMFGLTAAAVKLLDDIRVRHNNGLLETSDGSISIRTHPNFADTNLLDPASGDMTIRDYDTVNTFAHTLSSGKEMLFRVDWMEQDPGKSITLHMAGGFTIMADKEGVKLTGPDEEEIDFVSRDATNSTGRRLQTADNATPQCLGNPEVCCARVGGGSCLSGYRKQAGLYSKTLKTNLGKDNQLKKVVSSMW
ncbi:unnamed protein product [Vitrella brassicaformis CCMP3155]|uniref:EF-hand domain-containing protein n=1 Tax=Vitrella brassicaformis (strain CCMP3155) TaxID=1169540 RepID=A0A0G4GLD2_VITBC|nr:unnamed protein product [Vitrella brassicaformis CCMP3155]|mmetsp:Transcript_27133/g.67642  ORF Transcript_27133/g.67642 Transcript_27133/m.67642 type:complete len:274 (-) Transcript_27133:98-919(-)|eukprot:CEM30940.1 unnamed protein product [Vitrella brassicaformis CCMP3155]